ncbi:GlxA family transcriptional regulator [Psychromarinibacter halotolerans]|uniref:GlxA family transcriptional regulator n=1 Tax=Psychromarinibacter halotolerans TaxID=1775175 RepID=A0ABV7GZ74_9RHOB|nr:helix-turn-helix domain-containing protein [Psychromarinibacter halotolerans]MAQ82317.1 AraC family transcriptional regulator [Maritimibacter sp.]MDF0597651.1 helix-turn-helix domain-containing protein [Psychromarinibacter halotolerans]
MAADLKRSTQSPPTFLLFLQPEFPLNALVLAVDALRIANQNSGRELFRWMLVSETGGSVRASNGMWLDADCSFETMPIGTHYLVFEGNLPTQHNSPKLLNHLRAAARFGATVGSADTGGFALAQAGLVGTADAPAAVVHWEATRTFQEVFQRADIVDQLYLIGNGRAQSAGGVATLDMMLDLIAGISGEALADEVANAMVHTRRPMTQPQRNDSTPRPETETLAARLVAKMEQNLDFPLPLEELAEDLALSPRTLSRLCQRTFGESPMRLYLRIRIQAARNFLFYEEFSIGDVAIACGFSYPAVFSRAFKKQYGQTPRDFREHLRRNQFSSLRPEIRRLARDSKEPPLGA